MQIVATLNNEFRLASCIVRSESKSKEAKDLYQGLTATVNGPDLMPFHGKLSFCD